MTDIILYGPHWSAYTRTVRLTLIEKQLEYRLEEVDFLNGEMPSEQIKRHPFGKVPAFQHGDYFLYETAAICRYIDAAFPSPPLQPVNAQSLGRMAQIIGILDAYISEPARMDFSSELLINPLMGFAPDLDRAQRAEVLITNAFEALCDCMDQGQFMAGNRISLADLHAAPIFDYIDYTPGGDVLISSQPQLSDWWSSIKNRQSLIDTRPSMSAFEPD